MIKVTSKADRWKESEKSSTKNLFLFVLFSVMSLLSKLLTPPSADKKKNSVSTKRLYTNDALSSILFRPVTTQLFRIAAPFPMFSILTILLDKCQMKSFKNINILIEVILFCLKNFFFWKKAFIWKTFVFEKKKLKKLFFFEKKNCFWKKYF